MHTRLSGSKRILTFYQIINKPDFPSLADEIVEPHPDMNIKVATFTASKKSINTLYMLPRNHMLYPFYRSASHDWAQMFSGEKNTLSFSHNSDVMFFHNYSNKLRTPLELMAINFLRINCNQIQS